MYRAYSIITVEKAATDGDKRIIEGTATTPEPDRVGDIIEPEGAQFKNPIPLLWQHKSDKPIGRATLEKPTAKGIRFKAIIEKMDEPGVLKDRLDEAWQSIKIGLVRAVSIGFRAMEHSYMDDGGIRFLQFEILELSAVTIPANAQCTMDMVKSIDTEIRAASGREDLDDDPAARRQPPSASRQSPGVPGSTKTRNAIVGRQKAMNKPLTIAERISAMETERAEKHARMEEIFQKAAEEGRTRDEAEREEFNNLQAEVNGLDDEIKAARAIEKAKVAAAKVVDTTQVRSIDGGDGQPIRSAVRIKAPDLPKGTRFARYAMALAAGRGSISDALEYAKRWDNQTPEVSHYIKAVAGSTSTASGEWGHQLVYQDNLASEFIELLRPATIIGRMQGIRRVPFNVRIPRQTTGSTVNWVGERAAKPVSELDFDSVTLGYDKIAGIVVLSEELVRLSQPDAEETVRRDLVEQIARFMDAQFLDPSITASANRPASITNGVTAISAIGNDADDLYADMNTALAAFDDAEQSTSSIVVIMRTSVARGVSAIRNALGQFEFPTLSAMGGTLMGYPVIVSNSAPANTIVLVLASEILMADDGRVTLDASREATLDMDGGDTPTMSLWQKNLVGIRAERWVTWAKRRATAVAMIDNAAYAPVATSG